jgi:hypothetical protein
VGHELTGSGNQYTPNNTFPEESYSFIPLDTNLSADNFNEVYHGMYDKITYLRNNLTQSYTNLLNLAYKLGLDVFTKLDGTITSSGLSTIVGSSTKFLQTILPGNFIRVSISTTTFLYLTVKSVEDNTHLTVYEEIGSSDQFQNKSIYLFDVEREYEIVNSELTSTLDPLRSLKGNIEYIGTYLKNVSDKLDAVINGLGFDSETGQSVLDDLTLWEYIQALEQTVSELSVTINNTIESLGFNADGLKGNYSSNNYVNNDEDIMAAIGTLDSAIASLSFADPSVLANLIITVGANSSGNHPGYPTGRRFITSTNTNLVNTLIELDSKMNAWPGMFDVIMDPSWTGVKRPSNIVLDWWELATYININGPNLSIFVKPSALYVNDNTKLAPVFDILKLSGCKFYGANTSMALSIVIQGDPGTADPIFDVIEFYGFSFEMALIQTNDGFYDLITLSACGLTLSVAQTEDQTFKFINCKYKPFALAATDVSDRAFIGLNSLTKDYATHSVTIEWENCHTGGLFLPNTFTNPLWDAPLIRHVESAVADSDIKLKFSDCDLYTKIVLKDATTVKDIFVSQFDMSNVKLTNHFTVIDIDRHVFESTWDKVHLFQKYLVAAHETDYFFVSMLLGSAPGPPAFEFTNLMFSDVIIDHRNPVIFEANHFNASDIRYISTRIANAVLAGTAMVKHSCSNFHHDHMFFWYSPDQLEELFDVSNYSAFPMAVYLDDIVFQNATAADFIGAGAGYCIRINGNAQGVYGKVRDVSIYHDGGVGARNQFAISDPQEKLLVENLQYFAAAANLPLQGLVAAWAEGTNQNFIYIGQGNTFVGGLFDFAAQTEIDLGEFVDTPTTLRILTTGLYRVTITITDTSVAHTGLIGGPPPYLIVSNNAKFTNMSYILFPAGLLLAQVVGAAIGVAGGYIGGETFDTVLELEEGADLEFDMTSGPAIDVRFVLERIK